MNKFYRILLLAVGVLAVAVLMIGCQRQRYDEDGNPIKPIEQQANVSKEEIAEICEAHWKEKYDENFTVEYLEARSVTECVYRGQATSESMNEGVRFEFVMVLWKDGTYTCEDEYFQFTIREEYENYMSDLIKEVFPEHKIYQRYSINDFPEIKKGISFEEFIKQYKGKENAINFDTYVNSNLIDNNLDKKLNKLSQKMLDNGFYGSVTVHFRDSIDYEAITRFELFNFKNRGYIILTTYIRSDNSSAYEIYKSTKMEDI